MESCVNCQYYNALRGVCRKNPPVVCVDHTGQRDEWTGYYYMSRFPCVDTDEWCGKWTVKSGQ